MTFDEKVKFLRTLPQFKVIPLSEVRAVAFAAKEKPKTDGDEFVLGQTSPTNLITVTSLDITKIVREYPDLASKFPSE